MSDNIVTPEPDGRPEGVSAELWATLNAPAEHSEDLVEGYVTVTQEDGTEAVQAVASDDPDFLGSLEYGGQIIMEDHPDKIGLDADGTPLDAPRG